MRVIYSTTKNKKLESVEISAEEAEALSACDDYVFHGVTYRIVMIRIFKVSSTYLVEVMRK